MAEIGSKFENLPIADQERISENKKTVGIASGLHKIHLVLGANFRKFFAAESENFDWFGHTQRSGYQGY